MNSRRRYASRLQFFKQYLTSSGTWTAPEGCKSIDIFLVGGGGAGGRYITQGYTFGGTGAGGGTNTVLKVPVTPNTSYSYTIGSGGVASYSIGSGGIVYNGNGGDSSITINGITYSAPGGKGGKNSRNGDYNTYPDSYLYLLSGSSADNGGLYNNGGLAHTWDDNDNDNHYLKQSSTNNRLDTYYRNTPWSGNKSDNKDYRTGVPEFWEPDGLLHAAGGCCGGWNPVTDFTDGSGSSYNAGDQGYMSGGGGYGGGGAGGCAGDWYTGSRSGKNGGQGVIVIRGYKK